MMPKRPRSWGSPGALVSLHGVADRGRHRLLPTWPISGRQPWEPCVSERRRVRCRAPVRGEWQNGVGFTGLTTARRRGNHVWCSAGFPVVTDPRPPDDPARKSSFRQLVEPEIEVLLRVALTITSNRADAEDLVQETLLRSYRAIDRFDGRHPRAWLLTILRNTNANMHRRQRPGTIGDWELIRSARPAFGRAELPSAEENFVAQELHTDLDAAIRALDPRFRAALILIDVHDLSYAEAAAVMGVPVGTVMSRLSRARNRVRTSLRFSPLIQGDPS